MPDTPTPASSVFADDRRHTMRGRVRWAFPFLAALLPIVLLSVYSYRIASDSVRSVIRAEQLSAVSGLSQLMTQEFTRTVSLQHAIASVPGTVESVRQGDDFALRTRMKAIIVSYPQISRAFLTDPAGRLISEFPTALGSGVVLASEEWYQNLAREWKPSLSGVYRSPLPGGAGVVALAVPVSDAQGSGDLLGALVFEYDARQVSQWLQNFKLSNGGYLYVLDHHGRPVAHPGLSLGDAGTTNAYASAPPIVRGLAGALHTSEYTDPLSGRPVVGTVLPISVGRNRWLVVAEQPTVEAFAELRRVSIGIGAAGGVLTLFTLAMVVALARTSARNIRLSEDLHLKNQALTDFTSIVSHQLKAPITAMRWTLESILEGDYGAIGPDLRPIIENLVAVNISNNRLIMDILNVSRLDRGVVALETAAVTLRQIVDRAVRDYRSAAEHAGLFLKIEGDAVGDVTVIADLEKAAESITNSISNALKYTKHGGITVRMARRDNVGVIEITDTGEGMAPEILEHLFSRDGIRKANAGAESSSGLGLYIAREFMRMQGGDVTASSEVGQGSIFTYTLPLAQASGGSPRNGEK